jgi:hypothetical protein
MTPSSVTAPHAVRTCSLPTRMMHRFVVDEKYFTNNDLSTRPCRHSGRRTCHRVAYSTPPGISKVNNDALLECCPDLLSGDLYVLASQLVVHACNTLLDGDELDQKPPVLEAHHE